MSSDSLFVKITHGFPKAPRYVHMSAYYYLGPKDPDFRPFNLDYEYELERFDGECENSFIASPRNLSFYEMVFYLIIEIEISFVYRYNLYEIAIGNRIFIQ